MITPRTKVSTRLMPSCKANVVPTEKRPLAWPPAPARAAAVQRIAGFCPCVVRWARRRPTGGPMTDTKTADRELQTYIRPQTFPVAIRMLKPGEPIPERAKRPARDFKKLSMNCQVIDMSRRYGWTIALTREDHVCSLGITALGFDRPTHLYSSGTLCEGMYTATKEAGARADAPVPQLAPPEDHTLLLAPRDRC